MDEAVRLSIKGDKELRRKLRHFAKGRTRWKMSRKAVTAGLTPILKEARQRVPDVGDEALSYRFRRTRKVKAWEWKTQKGGLRRLLQRSLAKRLKGYPARGILWGGVGIKTRIRVRPAGWTTERALSTVAWDIEQGTAFKEPQPFLRPAFDCRRSAAVMAMKRKLDLEIAKEAKTG